MNTKLHMTKYEDIPTHMRLFEVLSNIFHKKILNGNTLVVTS